MSDQPLNLDQARQIAASAGVSLTAADYRRIAEIQTAARDNEIADEPNTSRLQQLVSGFNRQYPNFLKALTGLAEVMITTSYTVIVAFGAPIVLVLLLIVEHSRVRLGIELFESDTALASFASASVVLLNTVLEFLIYHLEYKHGYTAERELKGSLRLYGSKIAYWLGIGKRWRAIELSPAHRYQKLQRLVTFTILALATAGSMRDVIAQQSGAWHRAIIAIVTDSSLSQMSTWAGGLLFAIAAVLSAQVVTAFLAIRSREILDGMNRREQPDAGEAAAVQYIMAKIANKTGQAEQIAERYNVASQEVDRDFLAMALPVTANPTNGNGKTHLS